MDWNNSKILAKKNRLYVQKMFGVLFYSFYCNNYAFNEKINCFYSTAYHNLKF